MKKVLIFSAFALSVYQAKRHFNGGKNTHFPDLTGKIVVITGANTGLGFIAAKEMAKLNPQKIIFACRSEKRGKDAIEQIKKEVNVDNLEFQELDLNDLESVSTFAKTFNYDKIDILLNNAGIMALPEREETKQGFEKQFGVNHVGHFLLTKLLLEKVKASPEGRIVNLSSLAHERGVMNFKDIHVKNEEYSARKVYAQSKLSNVLFTRQLDSNLKEEGVKNVKVCSLHPGVVRTELGRYMLDGWSPAKKVFYLGVCSPLFFLMTKTPWWGTQTSLHCCLIPQEQLESGAYYSDCKVKKEKFLCGDDKYEEEAAKLWEMSEEMVKDYVNNKAY